MSNFECVGLAGAWDTMPTDPKLPFAVIRLLRQEGGPDSPEPQYRFETGDSRLLTDLYVAGAPDALPDDLETEAEARLVQVEGIKDPQQSVSLTIPGEVKPAVIPESLSVALTTFLSSLGSLWTPDSLILAHDDKRRAVLKGPLPTGMLTLEGDTQSFEVKGSGVAAAGLRLIVVEMIRAKRAAAQAS